MIYLIEIESVDAAGDAAINRFATAGYTTEPGDTPSNAHFAERAAVPGNFERHLFGSGRTYGQSTVGAGEIEIVNIDGALDYLLAHAFDGRALRIYTLVDRFAAWSSKSLLFAGTTEGAEFPGNRIRFLLREQAELLRQPLQPIVYAGTTTSGGLDEAEGGEDLKDKPKPLLFGGKLNVPGVNSDTFDLIYDFGSNGLSAIAEVRDRGVALAATSDYATITALKAATVAAGEYATCLATGQVRLGGTPDGPITADVTEGATTADRTAGQIAKRILEYAGFVEDVDFLASDIAALDTFNGAECGAWIGTDEVETLSVLADLLAAIGASIASDRTGVFRMRAFVAPSGTPAAVFTRPLILDDAIERQTPGDTNGDKPAKKVTIRYGRNYAVQSGTDIDGVNATDVVKAFASEEWRQISVENATTAARHPLAEELTFDTALRFQTAASTEATRRLALYDTRRDIFRITVKTDRAAGIDLGDVVSLVVDRFGMSAGRLFTVIGLEERYSEEKTTMVLWG